jgi:hypothetical protein
MSGDNPYQPPSPTIVADLCAQAAWLDAIDDDTRLRLEWASDTIRVLMGRLVNQAHKLETLEATR